MVVHACNPNIQEVDEGGQGFKASFSCIATFWLAWVTCVKPKTGGEGVPWDLVACLL